MARLQSPYVPRVFDYGMHERMPFLVLELLRGTSLRGRLDALRAQGLRLSAAETARVPWQVAEALHVAHAEKVVHRDLKPDNIFLAPEGDSYHLKGPSHRLQGTLKLDRFLEAMQGKQLISPDPSWPVSSSATG